MTYWEFRVVFVGADRRPMWMWVRITASVERSSSWFTTYEACLRDAQARGYVGGATMLARATAEKRSAPGGDAVDRAAGGRDSIVSPRSSGDRGPYAPRPSLGASLAAVVDGAASSASVTRTVHRVDPRRTPKEELCP